MTEQEWAERVKQMAEQARERRRKRGELRADLLVRRMYGLESRHSAKLARIEMESK